MCVCVWCAWRCDAARGRRCLGDLHDQTHESNIEQARLSLSLFAGIVVIVVVGAELFSFVRGANATAKTTKELF